LGTSRGALISDQVHDSGTTGFFFMPPMVPKPAINGLVDADLAPTVTINQIDPSDSHVIRNVATFTKSSPRPGKVRVHLETDPVPDEDDDMSPDGYFVSRWVTSSFPSVVAGTFYRVTISVDGRTLGFADVDVVANTKAKKLVDPAVYVPLIAGDNLRIKFRIEAAAVDLCANVHCSALDSCHVAGTCDPAT
jgi:hypothetical protein